MQVNANERAHVVTGNDRGVVRALEYILLQELRREIRGFPLLSPLSRIIYGIRGIIDASYYTTYSIKALHCIVNSMIVNPEMVPIKDRIPTYLQLNLIETCAAGTHHGFFHF